MNTYTRGPLAVRIDDTWPFTIRTFNAAADCVFVRDMPSHSTRQKSASEALAGKHMGSYAADAAALNQRAYVDEVLRAMAPDILESLVDLCELLESVPGGLGERPAASLERARALIGRAK